MSGEEQTEIRHLWLKQIWFQTSAWVIVGIVWVFSALWFVIKWGFAPIALLVDFLILLPLGKLILKTPSKLEGKLIDEAELPDHVWEWMEQSRLRLLPDGYVNGQLIKIDHLAENQVLYALSLVHPEKKLGVGLNYLEATKDTNKERLTDLTFAEFTLKCPDGSDMDLSNQQQVDPIPRIPGRQRYIFSQFGVQELSMLAERISESTGCETSADALDGLLNDLPGILGTEFDLGTRIQLEQGYSKPSSNPEKLTLTWKGAFLSTLRTLWPTSAYYKHVSEQSAQAFCESLGIEMMELYEQSSDHGTIEYDQAIPSLEVLQSRLSELGDRIPRLKEYRPQNITCSFDDSGTLQAVEVSMEFHKHYPVREYIVSTECYLHFDNEQLQCEYSCDSFDSLRSLAESEELNHPALLSSLEGYLSIDRVLEIAASNHGKQDMEVSEATLESSEEKPVWNVVFVSRAEDDHAFVSVDAVDGSVVEIGK